ncbi:hypothetical protein DMENIID0001_154670 [Sergentomyia squamirostris]
MTLCGWCFLSSKQKKKKNRNNSIASSSGNQDASSTGAAVVTTEVVVLNNVRRESGDGATASISDATAKAIISQAGVIVDADGMFPFVLFSLWCRKQ